MLRERLGSLVPPTLRQEDCLCHPAPLRCRSQIAEHLNEQMTNVCCKHQQNLGKAKNSHMEDVFEAIDWRHTGRQWRALAAWRSCLWENPRWGSSCCCLNTRLFFRHCFYFNNNPTCLSWIKWNLRYQIWPFLLYCYTIFSRMADEPRVPNRELESVRARVRVAFVRLAVSVFKTPGCRGSTVCTRCLKVGCLDQHFWS